MEPKLPESWHNLGWLYRRNRQPAEALRAYERALKLNEAFVPAIFNLANTHELYTRSSARWRTWGALGQC